jgi:hypothetical protein
MRKREVRRSRKRPAWVAAGGLVAALLAGLLAAGINFGILRAAGDPRVPGQLGPIPIYTVPSAGRPSTGAPSNPPPSRHVFDERDDD